MVANLYGPLALRGVHACLFACLHAYALGCLRLDIQPVALINSILLADRRAWNALERRSAARSGPTIRLLPGRWL